jgi:hypothetical protein
VPACLPPSLPACLPARLPACLPALPACLPCLPASRQQSVQTTLTTGKVTCSLQYLRKGRQINQFSFVIKGPKPNSWPTPPTHQNESTSVKTKTKNKTQKTYARFYPLLRLPSALAR